MSKHDHRRSTVMVLWCLVLSSVCLPISPSAAVEPWPSELALAKQWMDTRFDATSPVGLPCSFQYDGRPSTELLPSWTTAWTSKELDAQRSQRTSVITDPKTGLVIRCVATSYRDFPAVEWVLSFENRGSADTPILEDVQALDAEFGAGAEEADPFTLHHAEGSRARITDFQPLAQTIGAGDRVDLSSFGGRSSDTTLPFFNLAAPRGGGTVIGVGWTGQWAASFVRSGGGGVRVQAGMEVTHLRLRPGEAIRTPAILLLSWAGSDRMRGQNLLRQLLLHHYTPCPSGKPVDPPSAASPHAVIGFEDTTAENMLRGIRNIAAHRVPVDYWWMDTGWFPCARNWARFVGNPDPDPARFPNGLRPIADAAHEAGMKFLLWFEPERVMPNTWLYEQHPQWLLRPTDDMPAELKYQINDGFHLLDLGNPEALAWVKDKISGMIGSEGIDCYRNDFNMYPLYYWRNGEPVDRQGMREIRYITGLYDFFDTLQRQHPDLLLDNCASGGRRIDFEMLRRALVLTRSDYLWDPVGQQCHTYGLAQWIPITGIGAASVDRYQCRSGLGAHYALAADFYSEQDASWEAVHRTLREYKSLKPLYAGDFYPLGTYSTAQDDWMAWQFHRADLHAGVVHVFRREQSSIETASYRLLGLDANARYLLRDVDHEDGRTMTGKELMERGYTIRLLNKPEAAIVRYSEVTVTLIGASSYRHRVSQVICSSLCPLCSLW